MKTGEAASRFPAHLPAKYRATSRTGPRGGEPRGNCCEDRRPRYSSRGPVLLSGERGGVGHLELRHLLRMRHLVTRQTILEFFPPRLTLALGIEQLILEGSPTLVAAVFVVSAPPLDLGFRAAASLIVNRFFCPHVQEADVRFRYLFVDVHRLTAQARVAENCPQPPGELGGLHKCVAPLVVAGATGRVGIFQQPQLQERRVGKRRLDIGHGVASSDVPHRASDGGRRAKDIFCAIGIWMTSGSAARTDARCGPVGRQSAEQGRNG
jgi:hypothetical protein